MQVGLIVIDEDPVVALDVARAADRAGIHSVWTIDYYNRNSLSRAAMMAAATEAALIGTSVTPLFARSPLALAAAVSDIQGVAGGRFILGVGSSTRRMNSDWYGAPLEHPAPQAAERIKVIRALLEHKSGRFAFDGRFDRVELAHLDRTAVSAQPQILAAGVGEHMIGVAGRAADGFVGHPIATAQYLASYAWPRLEASMAAVGKERSSFRMTTQVIAAVAAREADARARVAAQVGFYSTVKGYDALFPAGAFASQREAARDAFSQQNPAGVARAAMPIAEERAVYGRQEDVSSQLARYSGVVDWVLLYPPHYGIEPAEITANELALIEVAACWTS